LKLIIHKGKNILSRVGQLAGELGVKVHAVGGFVRDLYLGKTVTDIDFVVLGNAIHFAESFKNKYQSGKVVAYPRFGTAAITYQKYKLEFVTARSESYKKDSRKPQVSRADLRSDLSRRDFTINTLLMELTENHLGEIIDMFHGIGDIDNKLIRTPLDPIETFSDDPLRILRAIRFATVLEFRIEEKTYQAIIKTSQRLSIISQERITEEFRKLMLARKPSQGLIILLKTGILEIIFPELVQLAGVEQRQEFHHKDVFYHTVQVVDNIAEKSDNFELRLAALLHDIAKPQTKQFAEGVGWTFHGHEDLGARMVERIGRRMRLPLSTIRYVQKLVRLHLRPMQLVDESVTDSAIRRLMVEAGNEIDDLMALCRADITSKNPEKVRQYLTNFDMVEQKMHEVEEKDNLRNFRPAINGNIIMKILNIPAGPRVGKIKKAIVDAILDGKIPNQEKACLQYMMEIKDDLV
jgi:poly(A) polymerase